MKKTPVQELIEELKVNDVAHGMYWIKRPNEFFEKYLEKEKEQIMRTARQCHFEGVRQSAKKSEEYIKYGEEYYNETYNQNK